MKCVWGLLILFLVILSAPACATEFTPAEKSILPSYCQDKLAGRNSAHWREVFRDDWEHMMHYCSGMVWAFKAQMASPSATGRNGRGFFLNEAAHNFQYSIRSAKSRGTRRADKHVWPLLADAYYRLGRVHAMQGNKAEAVGDYLQAVTLKRSFLPAYLALADWYEGMGDLDAAGRYVTEGLRYLPKSKILLRRKIELDRKSGEADTSQTVVTDH